MVEAVAKKSQVKKVASEGKKVIKPKVQKVEQQIVVDAPIKNETEEQAPVETSVEARIKALIDSNDNMIKTLKDNKQELKAILVSYQKELKGYKKKKNKVKSAYTPHGFTKAVKVSESLAKFLGQEPEALIARPSVTKAIAKYVRENGLAKPEDGSIFTADKTLKSILGEPVHQVKNSKPELGLGYSYQNLQKYLSVHFTKSV